MMEPGYYPRPTVIYGYKVLKQKLRENVPGFNSVSGLPEMLQVDTGLHRLMTENRYFIFEEEYPGQLSQRDNPWKLLQFFMAGFNRDEYLLGVLLGSVECSGFMKAGLPEMCEELQTIKDKSGIMPALYLLGAA